MTLFSNGASGNDSVLIFTNFSLSFLLLLILSKCLFSHLSLVSCSFCALTLFPSQPLSLLVLPHHPSDPRSAPLRSTSYRFRPDFTVNPALHGGLEM